MYRPYYMAHNIWTMLYAHILWTILYAHIIWLILNGLKNLSTVYKMDSMDINVFVLVGSMVNSVKKRTEITTIPMSVRQVITTVMNMRHALILRMGSSANVILDSMEMEKRIA